MRKSFSDHLWLCPIHSQLNLALQTPRCCSLTNLKLWKRWRFVCLFLLVSTNSTGVCSSEHRGGRIARGFIWLGFCRGFSQNPRIGPKFIARDGMHWLSLISDEFLSKISGGWAYAFACFGSVLFFTLYELQSFCNHATCVVFCYFFEDFSNNLHSDIRNAMLTLKKKERMDSHMDPAKLCYEYTVVLSVQVIER
jgi:hypothetical protein